MVPRVLANLSFTAALKPYRIVSGSRTTDRSCTAVARLSRASTNSSSSSCSPVEPSCRAAVGRQELTRLSAGSPAAADVVVGWPRLNCAVPVGAGQASARQRAQLPERIAEIADVSEAGGAVAVAGGEQLSVRAERHRIDLGAPTRHRPARRHIRRTGRRPNPGRPATRRPRARYSRQRVHTPE